LIIHNAWRVNFNLALASFKPMVRGVRNLVDTALRSPQNVPPRIIFTGSVGVFRNWKSNGRPREASIEDPALVLGSGYSESKFVGERILENAAKSTPLRPIIVRIGQMTSNSSGAWNASDWLPAIVRSGQVLCVLPARDDSIAWISLDTAARAIVDFRTTDAQYLHLAHPSPVPWNTVFDTFSSLLNVPLVSWTEWLSKLEKDNSTPQTNPALHLLDFFRGCSPVGLENREALGIPFLDISEALKCSSTLSDSSLPRVAREDAEGWVAYWRSKNLLVTQ